MRTRFIVAAALVAALFGTAAQQAAPPAIAAANGSFGWVTSACYSHSLHDDPIVHPDMPGMSHLHDFAGALNTSASTTTADEIRAGGTCTGTAGDSAAYWVPSLSTSNAGALVPSSKNGTDDLLVYYRDGSPVGATVQPFPDGFSMIVGNANATSLSEAADLNAGHIHFKCGPGPAPQYPTPPATCPVKHFLTLVFEFPQYWTGNYTPGANSYSEMSYKRDAAHQVVLPKVRAFWRYSGAGQNTGTVTLANMATGQNTSPYYTAHMDFFNAWDPASLANLVTNCINAHISCGKNPAT